ncbi:MAG: DUF4397 domain-containing protein [Kofleriaceae bacterium]
MKNRSSLGLGMSLVAIAGCAEVKDPDGDSLARVRVAHVSPDAPAVDFCLAPHGSAEFTGPVLAGAGGPTGVSYGNVTRYLEVAPIQYDVRIVAPGQSSCATGILPDITNLPELAAGSYATLAASGLLDHGDAEPFALRPYFDDATVSADRAKLRFIHASPGTPNVDVGLGGGALFTPVFEDIAFGTTRTHDNGYLETAPFTGAEISARATGTVTDVLAIKPAALPAGTIATAFAIGRIGDAEAPLGVLLCIDNSPAHGLETECSIVGAPPERVQLRVAHLSPDAPPVDVCLAPAGTGAFGAPLLATLGARSGLAYSQVTAYVAVPVATYDVRVILATATTCDTPAVPDTNGVAVSAGLTATVAAIGVVDPSGAAAGDPTFRLAVFADATQVPSNRGKLRLVHASPGTPNVDVGLGSGHGFQKIYADVPFGTKGTNAPLDPLGYLETDPFSSPISARVANTAGDALTVPAPLPAGASATACAMIGNKTGSATNPLRVLLCVDNAKSASLLSTCNVL